MKIILILTIFAFGSAVFSQTKIIAHKSHSGSKQTFSKLLKENDLGSSNFGVAPEVDIKKAQLDSLIFVNDTTQVMVTTISCSNRNGEDAITSGWSHAKQKKIEALKVSEDKKTSIWEAGRDTVYNHRIFSNKNDLRYIKVLLDSKYYFTKPAEEVVFVGYSDKPEMDKAENSYINITLFEEDYLVEIEMTGLFEISGYFGLEKKDEQGKWKVLIPLDNKTDSNTPNIDFFVDDSEKFPLAYFARQIEPKNKEELEKGVYRLFARTYGRNDLVYSNEFKIK